MNRRRSPAFLTLLALISIAASSTSGKSATDHGVTRAEETVEPVLVGPVTRAEIEQALPQWVSSSVESSPEPEAAFRLADLVTTARITVFFGSWCSDSERELARLWKALDIGGGEVGFQLEYVAVDRNKLEPEGRAANKEILYVPTFIVEEGGTEIGRVIETSPNGIEVDLASLLDRSRSGWVSTRDDLPDRDHDGQS